MGGYSVDFRNRVVQAIKKLGLTYKSAAEIFYSVYQSRALAPRAWLLGCWVRFFMHYYL